MNPETSTPQSHGANFKFRRLGAIARKEAIHILRDWRSLYLSIAIPIILILLFGYALNLDLNKVPTLVWDQSHTPRSRDLIALFSGSPYFSVDGYRDSYRDLQSALEEGHALLAIVIPADFARRVQADQPAQVQILADGSDANTARLAIGYAEAIGNIYNQNVLVERISMRGGSPPKPAVELSPRAWYNPDLRSPNVIIPGIIAIVMIVISAMLTSVTVAREWEAGTMEQLISTPVRVPELVIGKAIPYFVIGMLDVAISAAMGKWLYGVPLRGNTGLLFAMSAIFLTGALFLGMMLSIVLKSQVLANQTALLVSYLPTLMLSGFVFTIANMPKPIQILTYIFPARYFIAILRGIYLKGIGLEILALNALLLSAYAALMVLIAHKRMKLKLE